MYTRKLKDTKALRDIETNGQRHLKNEQHSIKKLNTI